MFFSSVFFWMIYTFGGNVIASSRWKLLKKVAYKEDFRYMTVTACMLPQSVLSEKASKQASRPWAPHSVLAEAAQGGEEMQWRSVPIYPMAVSPFDHSEDCREGHPSRGAGGWAGQFNITPKQNTINLGMEWINISSPETREKGESLKAGPFKAAGMA